MSVRIFRHLHFSLHRDSPHATSWLLFLSNLERFRLKALSFLHPRPARCSLRRCSLIYKYCLHSLCCSPRSFFCVSAVIWEQTGIAGNHWRLSILHPLCAASARTLPPPPGSRKRRRSRDRQFYLRQVPFREFWLDSSGCEASRRIRCRLKTQTAQRGGALLPPPPLLLGCLL